MPQYLEFTTDDELEDALEWMGRVYAQSTSLAYPMVPEWWGPGRQPDDVTIVVQYYYRNALLREDADGGGVVEVDDTMLTWPAQTVAFDDGTSLSLDVTAKKKPQLLLSAKGRRAVTGVMVDAVGAGGTKVRQAVTQRKRKRRRRKDRDI